MHRLKQAFQLLEQGHLQQAEGIGRSMLGQYPNQPDVLNMMGMIEQRRGQLEKARHFYLKGLKSAPSHLHLLNSAGLVEKALKNYTKSEKIFIKALKLDPSYFYARQNLACLYQDQRKFPKAKRLYHEVIRHQPNLVDALANLSYILEKEHQLEEATSFANRALEISPDHFIARSTMANIAIREKKFDEVIRLLRPLLQSQQLTPVDRAMIGGKCAYAYENLGDYRSAFSFYQNANQLLYRYYEPLMQNPNPGMMYTPANFRHIENTIPDFGFSNETLEIKSPVFLIGFPRSGTTLLDQILSSHSQITVLEEKPNLTDAITRYPYSEKGLKALEHASQSELHKLRRSYWANVNRELGANKSTAIIVDKLPLNAFALLHINKLFPGAKIITALRDPRDCVFSCYQQRFGMNPAMFEMLNLDTAVSFYNQVMRVITGVRDADAFAMHFIGYEKVVENFSEEVKALIDFLELEWEDALFDYQVTAKARDIITPSASQVIQPLYTTSIGKWRHYVEWIGASFDPLDRWVEEWGYQK